MKPRNLLVVAALGISLLLSGQLVFPFRVSVGNDFAQAQEQERGNPGPKENIAPEIGTCDGIPSRYQSHDLPSLAFIAGIAFILGFRVASWMSKRQIARLRKVWGK